MQQEIHDPETGEVMQSVQISTEASLPVTALTGGDIINQLEDGQFSEDIHAAVADMIEYLNELSQQTGGKAKGSMTIKLTFSKEDNAFRIASDFDVKKPKMPRPRSIAWDDGRGNFCRFPPNQMQIMDNMRRVGGSGGLRRA